jgi:biofilm PGA synthesis N-glycosyltransferase PgaC
MQVLEAASIIGLIRRTQSLTGRVGIVAGVCGIFRRERVLAVGGYDARMATEDIDLTWRLLLVGWHTAYQPRALAGMEVPTTLAALWAQRKRWARGQGEVIHEHLGRLGRWRDHRLWLLGGESLASIVWVVLLAASVALTVLNVIFGHSIDFFGLGLAWGIAISVVATVQLAVAITLSYEYDRWDPRSVLVGAIYPAVYWLASAAAALRASIPAIVRGPREQRVVWSIPREQPLAGQGVDQK